MKCPVEEFLYMNSYRIHIHTCEFIYEFMYENSFYEFIYVNPQNMNSYMKSYTNKYNMAVRVSRFKIWQSGWSGSERRRRLRLWRCGSGKSLSQWGGLWRAKASRCAFGVRRAAASDWAASIEAGCGEWRRAAASDYSGSQRPVAAGHGGWRRAAFSDSGCGKRDRRWRVMNSGQLRVTWARANEPGLSLCVMSDSGQIKFHVLREQGLSDGPMGPWRQSVTLAAASAAGIFGKKITSAKIGHWILPGREK